MAWFKHGLDRKTKYLILNMHQPMQYFK